VETALEVLDRVEGVLRRHLGRLPAETRQAIERDVIGLLQMARASLPKELQQATRLLQEAEVTLARAREEARQLVLDAQSHARSLTDAGATGGPPVQGAALVDAARREADKIRQGADEYAAAVLRRLEVEVDRLLTTIRRGQEVLRAPGAAGRRRE
jgi:cell division septum initiation protein DivIVA